MERVPLAGDWLLWRDFAVRSAGFPVSGLDAFGPGDESARLRAVAADPRFQEAVTWQNPAALDHAVRRIASGEAGKPSRLRQKEEIVASYWQRYCAKTDTIGFFGPLAWGRIADDGPPVTIRSGDVVRERSVHLEAWPVQALAAALDPALPVAAGPWPERELRERLEAHPDPAVRERGLPMLERLVAARDAVAAAPASGLERALADLDATFSELTGLEPVRNAGRAYGARTLSYVDCMRDLDVTAGPGLLRDLAPALHVLFEASRWFCGEVHAVGRRIVEASLPGGRAPLGAVLGRTLPRLMGPPPELADVVDELHRRLGPVLDHGDPATAGARAAAAFADHRPAWPMAVWNSVDVHLCEGGCAAVVGDVHPGNNPLGQGVFAHRHPDVARFLRMSAEDVGPSVVLLPPLAPGMGVDARGVPIAFPHLTWVAPLPGVIAQDGVRTWGVSELTVDGDRVVELDCPVLDVFALPIFIAGVRTFELLPDAPHVPRTVVGRTVLQREGWSAPAAELPRDAAALAAWCRDRGMPRRLFAKSPLERKPMHLDLDSPVLTRILCRHARQAAEAGAGEPVRFTEMLPLPEQCPLTGPDGERYASELRLVAVDGSRAAVR